jgi:hypothetical protein
MKTVKIQVLNLDLKFIIKIDIINKKLYIVKHKKNKNNGWTI